MSEPAALELEAATAPAHRAAENRHRLGLFDAEDYRSLNPDIADMDPAKHFWRQGVWEGRPAISIEKRTAGIARAVNLAPLDPLSFEAAERAYGAASRLSPTLHLPAGAGERDRIVARHVTEMLDAAGLGCSLEYGPPDPGEATPLVIGAAALLEGMPREAAEARLRSAVVIAPGFPTEAGFSAELPYLLAAGGVAAVELDTYALFADRRTPACWCAAPVVKAKGDDAPAHPLMAGLSRAVRAAPEGLAWAERPIDVLALEEASASRLAAWSRMVEGMARFKTVYFAPPADLPTTRALRRHLYARSKIVLHLHEGPPTTLGAQLAGEVAGTGAVILAEPTLPHRSLHPGRHYFESSARRMPALVEELMNGAEGPALAGRVGTALDRLLAGAFEPEALGLALIDTMLAASERRR